MQALENSERYQTSAVEGDKQSSEPVAGIKTIEALGAIKVLSSGSASLVTIEDVQICPGQDLGLAIGRKLNCTVRDDMTERIEGARESTALVSQTFQAPTTWLGSEQVSDCRDFDTAIQAPGDCGYVGFWRVFNAQYFEVLLTSQTIQIQHQGCIYKTIVVAID